MQNVYRITWREQMQSCLGKLRTYSKFKKDFIIENYVIQFPLHLRRNFSKFRISAHNLAIETGRYFKATSLKPQSDDKRLCFHCKSIESEFHLMFECKLYIDERKLLIESLSNVSYLSFDATESIFCILMSCFNGDLEIGKLVCNFINACFEKRKDTLNEIHDKNILCRPETTITRLGRISKRPTRLDLEIYPLYPSG